MNNKPRLNTIERKFLDAIKHHLQGWTTKIENDFGYDSFNKELADLRSDPVYSKFGFDIPEYVLVRLIGRMSISVGRRLGEIYDKLPRFVAAARFNVSPQQVAEKFEGLELDIGLRYSLLNRDDVQHVTQVVSRFGETAHGRRPSVPCTIPQARVAFRSADRTESAACGCRPTTAPSRLKPRELGSE